MYKPLIFGHRFDVLRFSDREGRSVRKGTKPNVNILFDFTPCRLDRVGRLRTKLCVTTRNRVYPDFTKMSNLRSDVRTESL